MIFRRFMLIAAALMLMSSITRSVAAQSVVPCLLVGDLQGSNDRYNFIVRLSVTPSADESVTITPVLEASDSVQILPVSRRLTSENAQIGRAFTLLMDDADADPDAIFESITFSATSSDPDSSFDQIGVCDEDGLAVITPTPRATATIEMGTLPPPPISSGTPMAGITLTPSTITLVEGGASVNVTIRTTSSPHQNEALTALPLFDPAQVSVSPATRDIEFTSWSTGRIFAFSATDDGLEEGDHSLQVTFYLTSSDPLSEYFNMTAPVRLTINIEDAE